MIPLRLTLKNFIGIRKGLKTDEITIDFAALSGDAKLIAITGPNGNGKTTILDNAHPYRLMPSRMPNKDSGYSPNAFSYYGHTYGTAKKEIVCEHQGQVYRAILVIKGANKTKTTQAYLQQQEGDDWAPAKLPDGTVSDGKTRTYDACVNAIFGVPEMFFTSAFSCQSRRSLSAYANGEIKALLAELLGLNEVADIGKRAGEVRKGLARHQADLQTALAGIHEKEVQLRQANASKASGQASVTLSIEARRRARENVQRATMRLAEVQAENNTNADIEIQRGQLQRQISLLEGQRSTAEQQAGGDVTLENTSLRGVEPQRAKESRDTAQTVERLQAHIRQQQELAARTDEVAATIIAIEELEKQIAGKEQEIAAAKKEEKYAQDLRTKKAASTAVLDGIKKEGDACKQRYGDLATQAKLISDVPCVNTDYQGRCKLLASARDAKSSIPATLVELERQRERYKAENAELKVLTGHLNQVWGASERVRALEAEMGTLRESLQMNRDITALETAIKQSAAIIRDKEQQIAETRRSLSVRLAELDEQECVIRARIVEIEKRRDGRLYEIDQSLSDARSALSALPDPADTSAVEAAEKALEDADLALAEVEQKLEGCRAQVAQADVIIQSLKKDLAGTDQKKALAARIDAEIAYFDQLSTAFSNDGIIALAIDDAGPSLSALTNDLLLAAYGPRFSVSIRTQVALADGSLREGFEIMVFDTDDDSEVSLEDMSGGEKIWIEQCVIRAVALHQAQNYGQQYGCLFADETDGALDPKKKAQFMAMKRRVAEIGGYRREYFISHTPDLWELSDAKIDMASLQQ